MPDVALRLTLGRELTSARRAPLKPHAEPRADIVDPGVLAREQLRVAHVHPARLERDARGDADPDPELGLEQDAAAELDLVVKRVLEFRRRAGVDREPDPGANEDPVA